MGKEIATQSQEPRLGPAMRKLTERQRAFVLALRDAPPVRGGKIEAVRKAGYAGDQASLRVTLHRLSHSPTIQAAIKEVALGMLSSEGVNVISTLLDIVYGEIAATAGERLKAAAMVLNRIGMPEQTEHKVVVEHTVSNEEALDKLHRLSKTLNLDPAQLLGRMGIQVIDGEFTEVSAIEDKSEKSPDDDTAREQNGENDTQIREDDPERDHNDNGEEIGMQPEDPFAWDSDEPVP